MTMKDAEIIKKWLESKKASAMKSLKDPQFENLEHLDDILNRLKVYQSVLNALDIDIELGCFKDPEDDNAGS